MARLRLFTLLDEARDCPLVWVEGVAGSGKTTLVATYAKERKLRLLWYRVDAGDRDPGSTFYYLARAAEDALPGASKVLPVFSAELTADVEPFARKYFEVLFDLLPRPAVLVFDDCHELQPDALWFMVLKQAVTAASSVAQIVCVSRQSPPPLLVRSFATGEASLLGRDALRLSEEEATAIGGERSPGLSGSEVRELLAISDGWAAGFVLLTAGGRRASLRSSRVHPMTGTVFEYFAAEVFARLDETRRTFLLKTSLFPFVTERMARDLTGVEDASALLEALHRENFFTDRHDVVPPRYEYHPLFKGFLRARAKKEVGARDFSRLTLAAAAVLASHGHAEAAIELFVDSREFSSATRLILQEAPRSLAQGRAQTVQGWFHLLPSEVTLGDPWLLYWKAAAFLAFEPSESVRLCEQAFAVLQRSGDTRGCYLTAATAIRGVIFEYADFRRLKPWVDTVQSLVSRADFSSVEEEVQVTSSMLQAFHYGPSDLRTMEAWRTRAGALARQAEPSRPHLLLMALGILNEVFFGAGEVTQAYACVLRQAEPGESDPIARSLMNLALLCSAWAAGDGEGVLLRAEQGLDLAASTGAHVCDEQHCVLGVVAALARDKTELADKFIAVLDKRAHRSRMALGSFTFCSSMRALANNEPVRALALAREALSQADGLMGWIPQVSSRCLVGRMLIEQRRFEEARGFIEESRALAEACGSSHFRCVALFLLAALHLGKNESSEVRLMLEKAFSFGSQAGTLAIAWVGRRIVGELCAAALKWNIHRDEVRALVVRERLSPRTTASHVEDWPWLLAARTLGRAEVAVGDRFLRTGKVRELVFALAAFGSKSIPCDTIEEALWPNTEGDLAHGALKTTLHRLRKLIGYEPAIQLVEGRLEVDSRYCWSDVDAFATVVHRTETLRQVNPHRKAEAKVREIADELFGLYRGPFLRNERYGWAVPVRERLRQQFLVSVCRLGECLERAALWNIAAETYERALVVEDLSEILYLGAMRTYEKMGRAADAVRIYARCRDVLRAGLQVEPSFEARSTYARLKDLSSVR